MPAVPPHQKALAAIEAVLAAIQAAEDEPAISARLRARLGHGWSLTTALHQGGMFSSNARSFIAWDGK